MEEPFAIGQVQRFDLPHKVLTKSGGGQPIWVFGYGSLIHTPNFKYDQRAFGFINGYRRVFWQGSTDHRGTPQAPGRTVTLQSDGMATTWGCAFQLAGSQEEQQEALRYLEWREKQYDERAEVDVWGQDPTTAQPVLLVKGALTYIATSNKARNANYLGPAAIENIAKQVAGSCGPSGPNCEYVYKLAAAIRDMGVTDPELFDLEARVRQLKGDVRMSA